MLINRLYLLYFLLLFYLNADALRKFRLFSCCFVSECGCYSRHCLQGAEEGDQEGYREVHEEAVEEAEDDEVLAAGAGDDG